MYNSDGYILIDLFNVDMNKSNQYIPGLYHRVTVDCLGVNKLALVINAGDLTPMSAVINKSLNYYVITTSLYIFKINSNDILIIEEAGSTTVEVAIVPTLIEGTKIADFQVGSTTGELFAPPQQSEINDNVPSDHTTFSSDKINTLLIGKANSSDLATVATTGSYDDLANKPTIPTKVSQLQNDSGYVPGSSLATVATTGSYDDLSNKPTIPTKVSELQNDSGYITDSALSSYQTKTDSNLDTTANTVVGAINEINSNKAENSTIATEYDPTQTYRLSSLVIYQNKFYRAIADNITGAWDSTKWVEVTVDSELSNIVVKRTLTETTTGNGNVVNYIDVANGIIVSAICTSQEALVIPFMNSLGTMYSFHVMSQLSAHGVVANTQVTIDFYMIPSRRIV